MTTGGAPISLTLHTALPAQKSLLAEGKGQGNDVGIHIASPGMVATELLLSGDRDARAARFINILAEDAALVAAWLVPRMRGVTGTGAYFKCAHPEDLSLVLARSPSSFVLTLCPQGPPSHPLHMESVQIVEE